MCRKPHGRGKGKKDDDEEEEEEKEPWPEMPLHSPKEIHAMQKIRDRELVQKLWNDIAASLASYSKNLKYIRG